MTLSNASKISIPRVCIVQHTLAGYNVPLFTRVGRAVEAGTAVFACECDNEARRRLNELSAAITQVTLTGQPHLSSWIRQKTGFTPPSIRILLCVLRFQPGVIFVDGLSSVGTALVLRMISPFMRAHVVWWSLGVISARRRGIRGFIGDLFQRIGTLRGTVLAYSTHSADYFLSLGVARRRVIVGCNTIDELEVQRAIEKSRAKVEARRRELNLSKGDAVVVFSGTLKAGKQVDLLLRAFSLLKPRDGTRPVLLIIGDGSERLQLERLAHELGITDRLRFVGARGADEVSEFFLLGQFVVLPGLGGLAIPHAFAHALPVICGPADGVEKDLVVRGKTGILLESVSVSSLHAAITEMLDDPEECRQLGLTACEWVTQKYSIDAYCRSFLEAACHATRTPHATTEIEA
jgi:glycosyltransferase involved in cell wall biosynthesis